MPSENDALLEVNASASADVSPTSAFVHIVLTSDRFFSGRAAFEQAEELRRLAQSLAAKGVPESALALEGVTADVSSGLFTKSSSVTYRVRVLLQDLDLLASVLDAISEAKKVTLNQVEWRYDEDSPEEHAILRKAGERALAKARVLAEAVGATLTSLHTVREERLEAQAQSRDFGVAPMMTRARASGFVAQELEGMELAPKKRVTVRVTIAFSIRS